MESAKLLLDVGKYKDSIGRSYYAIFTAVRAVLANDKIDFSKLVRQPHGNIVEIINSLF